MVKLYKPCENRDKRLQQTNSAFFSFIRVVLKNMGRRTVLDIVVDIRRPSGFVVV